MTSPQPHDGFERLLAAARESRLVLFVGAGASMGAPTNLPSWRDVNRIVVRALASTAAGAVGDPLAQNAADLILERHANEKLPPEYQAQILAEFLYHRYFDVLRFIDSDRPNANHLAIAWLARLGCVQAVVTTNFDRLIETAFTAVGTPLETHYQPEHFRALATDLGRFGAPGRPCQLLKLHGSVDDPRTLIDTLAQRKKGFAPAVMTTVRHLLHSGHWLFLGFSGLDLEAEENYLSLNQSAPTAVGFTWFVRQKTEPRTPVVKLKERYGDRGAIVYGELPDWLLDFSSLISAEPASWIGEYAARTSSAVPSSPSPTSLLERGATDWATQLTPLVAAMSLSFVVIACAQPQAAATFVERLLTAIDDRWRHLANPPDGALLMKSVATSALGSLVAGLGRHEEAVGLFETAVHLAEQAHDDDSRDRVRGNLALSLETLGRIDEARATYESALAGYRERGDPVPLAFGLTSLASHFIRQMRLDDAKKLAGEAIEAAKRGGDERMRGIALNDLGMIAKLRGDYPRAIEIFTEVEALFARLGNDEAVAAAAGNRGEVLAAVGRYDEAEAVQRSVLEVEQRLERLDNQGATCLSLGLLNQLRGDAESAEQWFTEARELFQRIKDPSNEALALLRLASLANESQRFDDAAELAQAGLPLVSGKNPALTADLWAQLGKANLLLGYVVRAEQAYRETIALAERIDAPRVLAMATQNLGTALLLQQRDSESATAFARAARFCELLGDADSLAYCKLGEGAVRLDEKIAALSNAGHAAPDREQQQAAAREMLTLYPELIAMYEQIGAKQLVAAFCVSAASTARFVHEDGLAIDWFRKGASVYLEIGAAGPAGQALVRARELLQHHANALMRESRVGDAVPLLLDLAEVSGQLGDHAAQATAMYNAAIGVLQTSGDVSRARGLAQTASELFGASPDAADALRIVAYCDAQTEPH